MLPDLVVAIPALNEEDLIGPAVRAIAEAARRAPVRVGAVVFANDCTDGTEEMARMAAAQCRLPIQIITQSLPAQSRSAGSARRVAMAAAAAVCDPGGVLVSCDADATLAPGALAAIWEAVGAGADLVCGSISTQLPADIARSASIQRINAATAAYADLVQEVRFAIDRLYDLQPAGPRPHYIESGACIGLTMALYRRLGGLPDRASSEDRALVRAAEAAGAQVVYSADAHAYVSPRTQGRAAGGMAATILARLSDPDPLADQALTTPRALRREWRQAVAVRHLGLRPSPGVADPQLRASDLERHLAALRRFVSATIRPALAELDAAPARDLRVA